MRRLVCCSAKSFLMAAVFILVLVSCQSRESTPEAETATPATTAGAAPQDFQPVMWAPPNLNIVGFNYPELQVTIDAWIVANNQNAMSLHAWGIWTGLTQQTSQTDDGQPLLVFETWPDPADLGGAIEAPKAELQPVAQRRFMRRLQRPHQFHHRTAAVGTDESTVLAFVKYDPTAAQHITANNLFSPTALNNFLAAGPSIPPFPNTALSLKPVFRPLASGQLVQNRYFLLPTWPGSPKLVLDPTTGQWVSRAMPETAWGQCVWIDIQATGEGPGNGSIDTTCAADGSSRTDANTYGIDEFIHFRIDAAEAAFLNSQQPPPNPPVQAGDYAALVAMHVGTREIPRWTWQTFWWVPNPDSPAAPSSAQIATLRPTQLTGAARNYAQCTAYSMEYPPQPSSGGQNAGLSVYCFNPYLEAPFTNDTTPPDLPDSLPGQTLINGNVVTTPNDVGPQTNCMACHIRANYNPNPQNQNAPNYAGDRYTSLTDPQFNGTLQVDLLWSIPGNLNTTSSATRK